MLTMDTCFMPNHTDSHRKSISLMHTLHFQLCVVMDFCLLKIEKLNSVDSMSMFPMLQYTG